MAPLSSEGQNERDAAALCWQRYRMLHATYMSLEGFTVKKRKSSVAPLLNCMCSVYKRTTGGTANLAMVYSTWLHVAASSLSASAAKNGPAAGGPTNDSF